ncbi:DNA translocase FtsK 4TM domain-containing protein [Tepidamorphus sp. 3E244]|uniref:FtsK/SpoIIIE family DNA translocase n=1 Tax=Tepidamorphus sp. 3E244 TaxID=3385498 RepID=UPI0038FCD8C6
MARYAFAVTVMLLAACYLLALVTWSVDDPSLNHATNGPVSNLMGYPGAIVADMAMQLLGIASAWLALPIFLGGLRLARARVQSLGRWNILACIGGTLAAAGACAVFGRAASWPLPIGIGGFVGDALLALPALMLYPALGSLAAKAGAVIYGTMAIAALGWGTGLLWPAPRREMAADEDVSDRDDAEFDDSADDENGGSIGLGLLMHGFMTASSAFTRWRNRRKPRVLSVRNLLDEDEASGEVMERRQPDFSGRPPASDPFIYAPGRYSGAQEPAYDDYEDYDDDTGPAPAPAARVQSMRTELKPGRRAQAEAQPSLLPFDEYELPPLNLLSDAPRTRKNTLSKDALEQNARLLEGVLEDFGVRGEILNVHPGPVVTLYELEPAPGTKSSRVIGLADDIARSMSAIAARVAVVPGRNAIGIELPNSERETVFLRELLGSEDFEKNKAKLPLCLGKTIGGEPVIADLARMPHLLIAGTTGSGKSVAINTMILSLLYRLDPERCKLIMIDPKMLELSVYDGIPHLLAPVVTDPKKAVVALKWTVREMEDRYRKMSKIGVRNIDGFNARVATAAKKGETITRSVQTGFDKETGEAIFEHEEMALEPMPYLVVIVDEMADLMMVAGKDIEGAVQRLAQMARAAGIHIITATQRPSVDVITGTIKANFPTRISFQVTSKIDSRTILGEMGAEQLLGQGDMLYMEGGGRITRAHGPFVSDDEVEQIVAHLKAQGTPAYLEDVTEECEDDPVGGAATAEAGAEGGDLYDHAVAIVLRDKKASTSYVQRRLSIGYNRAATLIERMEEEGVISRPNAKGQRDILVGNGEDA